jgi:hypothetical protein
MFSLMPKNEESQWITPVSEDMRGDHEDIFQPERNTLEGNIFGPLPS